MAENQNPSLKRLGAELTAALGPNSILARQSLSKYTALRVGGPADLVVTAGTIEQLHRAVQLAWDHEVPCRVLGSAANVLVSDAGIRGLVVLNRARRIAFDRTQAVAESGASFSTLAHRCVRQSLGGLEWAVNIPGTVGGAVVGNAGAWGGNVASALVQATILEPSGRLVEWPVERLEYGYRTSALKRQEPAGERHAVVLRAVFKLRPSEREVLEAEVDRITTRRKETQPPGASCGSVFKNPPGDYAGRLIEATGLKGRTSGGAEVSPVHANFIVNHGGATAADIAALIDLARQTVLQEFGVQLELEIQFIGEWQTESP